MTGCLLLLWIAPLPPFIDGGPIEARNEDRGRGARRDLPPFIDGGPIEATEAEVDTLLTAYSFRRSSTAAPLKLLESRQ